MPMTAAISAAVGIALLAAGMAAVGYSVYLEMIHAVPLTWWDRALLIAPLGIIALLSGLVLSL